MCFLIIFGYNICHAVAYFSDQFILFFSTKWRIDKIKCFSDLHDYMDANTLGESEKVWEELTDDIGPQGDEVKVQLACDILNEAQTIVDEWIKQGALRTGKNIG